MATPDLPDFSLTLITRLPEWAEAADIAGVDQIGVDIERIGKHQRQAHIKNARISDHELSHLPALRDVVSKARLFARLNPMHEGSEGEIEEAIGAGAQVLMLPQFYGVSEVDEFVGLVRGRAKTTLLLEKEEVLSCLGELLRRPGIDEIMVGLNDLGDSLGLGHPMVMAGSPILDDIAQAVNSAGIRFGFGGVAGPEDDPTLPVQPDLLLTRYAQLNGRSAWISRSLLKKHTPRSFGPALRRLRDRIKYWQDSSEDEIAPHLELFHEQVRRLARSLGHHS